MIRHLRRALLPACLLFASAFAQALPYPDETQFRGAIAESASMLKAENIGWEVLDAQKEGLKRPLLSAGLSLKDRVCLIFFNTQPVADMQSFFDAMQPQDLRLWLNVLVVHETAHCVEQRDAYLNKQFGKVLPPGYPHEGMNVQGYLSVVRSGAVEAWGEAFADIAAVLYLKEAEPQRWVELANQLLALRAERAKLDPEHDTSPWLRKFIAEQPSMTPGQSIYERAFQLRRLYRPE